MNHHKNYEESLIPDEEKSDDDAEGQIAYGTQSPAPHTQMEKVPLNVTLNDKLNKILVGQTRTMEFLEQLNNKVDTLLELDQECQIKEAATTSYPSTSTTSNRKLQASMPTIRNQRPF